MVTKAKTRSKKGMVTKAKTRTKILLVDDEEDVTFSLGLLLENNGFNVDEYNDPSLAIANFKPNSYGLTILDVKMPCLNGFELYKKIREVDQNVKVLFLTALSDFSDYQEALDGIPSKIFKNCFVKKPVDSQELLRRISS